MKFRKSKERDKHNDIDNNENDITQALEHKLFLFVISATISVAFYHYNAVTKYKNYIYIYILSSSFK